MAITLDKLLSQVATDGVKAQHQTKLESASFFEALFKKTDDGDHKPSSFAIEMMERQVFLPYLNMIPQDVFVMKKLRLKTATEVSLTTTQEGELLVDCSLKQDLQKRNTMLEIEMELEAEESTEGVEQLRAHLADRFNDELVLAKQERQSDDDSTD